MRPTPWHLGLRGSASSCSAVLKPVLTPVLPPGVDPGRPQGRRLRRNMRGYRSRHVLDRPGRSAARQYGESRPDGFGCEGPPRSRDHLHALDGRNRHRPGSEGRPNVYHRLWGNVFSAKLDGSDPKVLLVAQGNLTGIAYCENCVAREKSPMAKSAELMAKVCTLPLGETHALNEP
jgi:hypothetical protein